MEESIHIQIATLSIFDPRKAVQVVHKRSEPALADFQRLLGLFAFCNVDHRAECPSRTTIRTIQIEQGPGSKTDPPHLAARQHQTVFDRIEIIAHGVRSPRDRRNHPGAVFRMDQPNEPINRSRGIRSDTVDFPHDRRPIDIPRAMVLINDPKVG